MSERILRLYWDHCGLLYWDTGAEAKDDVYPRMGAGFQRRVDEWGDDMNLAWGVLYDDLYAFPPQSVVDELEARHGVLADEMRAQGFRVHAYDGPRMPRERLRPLLDHIRRLIGRGC